MRKKEIFVGLFIALFLALIFSPFASPWPDGLEKVAEDKGFIEKGNVNPIINSPIPDYVFPGIESERLAISIAGITGTLIMFALGYGIALLLKRKII